MSSVFANNNNTPYGKRDDCYKQYKPVIYVTLCWKSVNFSGHFKSKMCVFLYSNLTINDYLCAFGRHFYLKRHL